MAVKKQHNQNAGLRTQNSNFNVVKTHDTRPETTEGLTCGLSIYTVLSLESRVLTEKVLSLERKNQVGEKAHSQTPECANQN